MGSKRDKTIAVTEPCAVNAPCPVCGSLPDEIHVRSPHRMCVVACNGATCAEQPCVVGRRINDARREWSDFVRRSARIAEIPPREVKP